MPHKVENHSLPAFHAISIIGKLLIYCFTCTLLNACWATEGAKKNLERAPAGGGSQQGGVAINDRHDYELLILNDPLKPIGHPKGRADKKWEDELLWISGIAINYMADTLLPKHLKFVSAGVYWQKGASTAESSSYQEAALICESRQGRLPAISELLFLSEKGMLSPADRFYVTGSWAVPKGQSAATFFPAADAQKLIFNPVSGEYLPISTSSGSHFEQVRAAVVCVCDSLPGPKSGFALQPL